MSAFDYVRSLMPKRLGEKRYTGRIQEDGLYTDRGPVLNMSAAGLRLRSSRRLKGTIPLIICSNDGRLDVKAMVIWNKRRGFFAFDVGVQFVDVDATTSQKLMRIAMAHGYPVAA